MSMSGEASVSRRGALRAGAALLAAGGVGGALSAPAAAEHDSSKPAYVTLSYNESMIERYQPLLILDGVEVEPWDYHALVARSAESDLDVIVGFHKYPYQEGVSPFGEDSHLGDREPAYVYVDSTTGEPIKVQYSAYHWYENTVRYENLQTDSSGDRAMLQVVPTHHQHRLYDGWKTEQEATDLPVKNLLETYPGWLENGLHSEIHPGAVYNPQEEMQFRDSWWRDSAKGWFERSLDRVWLQLGFGAAEHTDIQEL